LDGLAGCKVVNHHTLSDFRMEHKQSWTIFAQLLGMLEKEGLFIAGNR